MMDSSGGENERFKPRQYSAEELLRFSQTCKAVFKADRISSDSQNCLTWRAGRRQITRSDPLAFTAASRSMLDSSESTTRSTASHLIDASDDEEVVFQPRGKTTWHFHRRDHTTSSTDQPISAPADAKAQHSENFKRFYRAVVSPSHVRVTAGGRIVPNYRQPPPVFTWNHEKHFFEPTEPSKSKDKVRPLEESKEEQINSDSKEVSEPASVYTEPQADKTAEIAPTITIDHGAQGTRALKISPPGQFDASKPFIYNGRLVYPIAPGSLLPPYQTVSQDMLQNSQTTHNSLGTQYLPPPQVPWNQVALAAPHQSPQTEILMPKVLGRVIPHATAIDTATVPAVLVQQQIDTLQQHLRFLEQQLRHNKHQINEDIAKQQHQIALSQLSALEYGMSLRPMQSIFKCSSEKKSGNFGPRNESQSAQNVLSLQAPEEQEEPKRRESQSCETLVGGSVSLGKSLPVDAQKSRRSHAVPIKPIQHCGTNGSGLSTEMQSRSRLMAAAAKAPAFKPRSQLKTSDAPTKGKENSSHIASEDYIIQASWNGSDGGGKIDVSLFSGLDSFTMPKLPYGAPAQATTSVQHPLVPKAQTMYDFGAVGQHPQYSSCSQHAVGFDGATSAYASSSFQMTQPVAPYLMGFPPPGTSYAKAESRDLLYSRALNEEETRARHLYWGKAPKEASKGLPKFDGRDFYPPSPTKTAPTRANPSPTSFSQSLNYNTMSDSAASSANSSDRTGIMRVSKAPQNSFNNSYQSSILSIAHPPLMKAPSSSRRTPSRGSKHSNFQQIHPLGTLDVTSLPRVAGTGSDNASMNSQDTKDPQFSGKAESRQKGYDGAAAIRITPGSLVTSGHGHSLSRVKSMGPPPSFFKGMNSAPTLAFGAPAMALSSTNAQAFLPSSFAPGGDTYPASMSSNQSPININKVGRHPTDTASPNPLKEENLRPTNSSRSIKTPTSAADLLRQLSRREPTSGDTAGHGANATGPAFFGEDDDW